MAVLAPDIGGYETCQGRIIKFLERLVRERERIPPEYQYYGIPSPWLQVGASRVGRKGARASKRAIHITWCVVTYRLDCAIQTQLHVGCAGPCHELVRRSAFWPPSNRFRDPALGPAAPLEYELNCAVPCSFAQARCLRALQLFPPPDSAAERRTLHDVLQYIISISECQPMFRNGFVMGATSK